MVLVKDNHWAARIDPKHIREFSKRWYVFYLKSRNWVIAIINHMFEIFGRHFGLVNDCSICIFVNKLS